MKPKEEPIIILFKKQISAFEKVFKISKTSEIPELKLVDNRLSAKWNEMRIQVSGNKFLASSTLQRKYGKGLLQTFSIPTVEHRYKEQQVESGLLELPFNQFKYDKDILNAVFFLDEENKTRPNAIGNYLKSYQMIIPSHYKDPLVFFNEVKPILQNKVKDELEALSFLKYSIGLEVLLRKENAKGKPTNIDPPSRFYTEQKAVLNQDKIDIDEQELKSLYKMALAGK